VTASALFLGFAINLLVTAFIVRFIYYPARQNKDFVFTFLGFNTVIYFVVSFLTVAELGVGVGFGLFAIFSVLRYRTNPMPPREMTYLFVVIALPVMSATLMQAGSWALLLAVSAAVCAVLFVLEREWGFAYEGVKAIKYERMDLIRPDRYGELLDDLRARTGLALTRVEVGPVNFVNDSAKLRVYYDARVTQGRHFVEQGLLVGADED
jgi:hypothetical protein